MHPVNERLKQPGGLAERLYGLRKDAGLTQVELAADLKWPPTKVSKIENGNQVPSAGDIRVWTAGCGHPEAADDLLDILADIQTVSRRWKQRVRGGLAAIQDDYDRRVRAAASVLNAEILIMPGLLQTAGYARNIIERDATAYGTGDAGETVAARMRRQEVLYDTGKTFQFVITEAAMRTLIVPAQVMAGQLDRLLSLNLDNVTLGIIPMGVELDTLPVNGLLILDGAAIVETADEEREAGEEESEMYVRVFARLLAESVTGEEARRLIASAAEALRGLLGWHIAKARHSRAPLRTLPNGTARRRPIPVVIVAHVRLRSRYPTREPEVVWHVTYQRASASNGTSNPASKVPDPKLTGTATGRSAQYMTTTSRRSESRSATTGKSSTDASRAATGSPYAARSSMFTASTWPVCPSRSRTPVKSWTRSETS